MTLNYEMAFELFLYAVGLTNKFQNAKHNINSFLTFDISYLNLF